VHALPSAFGGANLKIKFVPRLVDSRNDEARSVDGSVCCVMRWEGDSLSGQPVRILFQCRQLRQNGTDGHVHQTDCADSIPRLLLASREAMIVVPRIVMSC